MSDTTRRNFLRTTAVGLAALGTGPLTLRSDAQPTPENGDLGAYGEYLSGQGERLDDASTEPAAWSATEDNIRGPFHRRGVPFRGKVTPPLEPGTVLSIRGRVWGLDTRQPLDGAVLDLWQANEQGRYDNDDPRNPPKPNVFINRARVITNEQGRYEYETIHPGAYRIGPTAWRPPHIHYWIRAEGYRPLITQLYFRDDPHQEDDPFIKPSLIIDLETHQRGGQTCEFGTFDIVLAPA